jgi:hypothetical protein
VRVVSATQLTVQTPAHVAGRVYVRVVRPDATSPVSTVATYIYLARPATLAAAAGTTRTHSNLFFREASCASASWCGAGGYYGIDTLLVATAEVYNGQHWGPQQRLDEPTFGPSRVTVSCVVTPTKLCMFGTDLGQVWRTTNGTTWQVTDLHLREVLGGNQPPQLSCASSRFCLAAAGTDVWTWNGTTWSAPEQVLGVEGRVSASFADLSCPTTAFCYAVTAASPATAIRWQRGIWEPTRQILPTGGRFRSITCSSAAYCLASGDFASGAGYLVYTGLAWSPPQPGTQRDTGGNERTNLECLSPTACIRTSSSGVETYNGSARPSPTGSNEDAVSCWAAYTCLVVQSNRSYVTRRGTP